MNTFVKNGRWVLLNNQMTFNYSLKCLCKDSDNSSHGVDQSHNAVMKCRTYFRFETLEKHLCLQNFTNYV